MRAAAVLVVLVLASGCLSQPSPHPDAPHGPAVEPAPAARNLSLEAVAPLGGPPAERLPASYAVLALIDSGIDPYQPVFRADVPPPSSFLPGFPGARPVALHLSAGPKDGLAQDRDALRGIQPGELVWFPGTRIVGAMQIRANAANPLPVYDSFDHGDAVAQAAVMSGGPEVLVVMVQIDFEGTPYSLEPLAAALRWVAAQPWIDVASVSAGEPAQLPLDTRGGPELVSASRAVSESGKMLVFAAGNEVVPAVLGRGAGPPWVVAVGGAQPEYGGVNVESAWLPDVVSDWTLQVPRPGGTSPAHYSGTSFAAPRVAGALAAARAALRGEGFQAGPPELRAALNATAVPVPVTAYKPLSYASHVLEDPPPVPAAPPGVLQAGWGYVPPGASRLILDHVHGAPAPANPNAAAMQGGWVARAAVWG